jgi:hypothetical protein
VKGHYLKHTPGLRCHFGIPWRDHFAIPIGSGKGCLFCDSEDPVALVNDAHTNSNEKQQKTSESKQQAKT